MAVRDPETEWMRVQAYRRMTPAERLAIAARMYEDAVALVRSSILYRRPDIAPDDLEYEVRRRFLPGWKCRHPERRPRRLGPESKDTERSRRMRPYAIPAPHSFDSIRHTTPDSAQDAPLNLKDHHHGGRVAETERDALFQALDALEALQIPYMVVGSFASTFWGRPRLTHDADLVVEIAPEKVAELARLLAPNFYAPQFVIEDAVRKRGQFNAIHLEVAFKVDLWLLKDSPYDVVSFGRRLLGVMFGRQVWVSSPEDVILSKLRWYRAAPTLARQLQDVVEVYEIQEPYLEQDYLDRWARELGVGDFLERVRREAARPPDA